MVVINQKSLTKQLGKTENNLNECEIMSKQNKIDSQEFKVAIQEYIKGEKEMGEVAKEFGMTKSNLSFYFNNKLSPNPVKLRKEFFEQVYKECKKHIDKEKPYEQLIEKYPFLLNKEKIIRLVKQDKIKTRKKVLSIEQVEKEKRNKEIIEDFESGMKVNEILVKHKIKRGLFISVLRNEYGVKSIHVAREIAKKNKK